MELELNEIKAAIDEIRTKVPWYPVYVTVSKEFNEELMKFLGWEDYKIWLKGIYDAIYWVSPFIDNDIKWMVWLFDYSQILWLWNSWNDNAYRLSHLFDNVIIKKDAKEESSEGWEDSWITE